MYRVITAGAVFLLGFTPSFAQLVSVEINYPPAALLAGIEGVAGFEVALSKSGKVTGCRITQTSGNAELDLQTCNQLRRTGRFKPAIDASGEPIRSTYAGKLRWKIPKTAPNSPPATARQ